MQNLDAFAVNAANTAMRSAADYVRTKHPGRLADDAFVTALIAALKQHVKASIGQALADAREAVEAGMSGYASQTFSASMALAGIAAAKEVIG